VCLLEYGELVAHNPVTEISSLDSGQLSRCNFCLICLSHLRWNFVFQRPHHLMTRFAREMPVYFIEEPVFADDDAPKWEQSEAAHHLQLCVPRIPGHVGLEIARSMQRGLLEDLLAKVAPRRPILWFYTPMALQFADARWGAATVYDCMDELSGFQGAPPEMQRLEAELLRHADVVFTGGMSLYEAKREQHPNVHPFPSAVDFAHFAIARTSLPDPAEQSGIARPRVGFFGVLDERLDRDLVAAVAARRPDWQLVFIGPVVKIDPESLPRAPNIHYLGGKLYAELPRYVANWDAAMMPFACNAATRFISPTKTPEYLACGKPVISTPITDVVRSWGQLDGVRIAATAEGFVQEVNAALGLAHSNPDWLAAADRDLATISWDNTWLRMANLIQDVVEKRDPQVARSNASIEPSPTIIPSSPTLISKGQARV
jgi:glycosyltransferase involved in cell wall biosynthesis